MKAVAYYRVSTAAQGRSGLGLEAQRSEIERLSRERGLQVLASFTEVESGGRNDRPELSQALHHAKITGAVLVIAKLDRLSRNASFLLRLRDSGARFMAADIPDANDVTIGVLAVIAQAEREAISKRTKEALASIKSKLSRGEIHVSKRSGRPVTRLGNPAGAQALKSRKAGRTAAISATRVKARERAEDLRHTVQRLVSSGYETPYGLAGALNELGVLSPRGGIWYHSSALNLLAKLQLDR